MNLKKEVRRCALCPRLLSSRNKSGLCQGCFIEVYKEEKKPKNNGKDRKECIKMIDNYHKTKGGYRDSRKVYKDYVHIL